jgi:hypothetical protein
MLELLLECLLWIAEFLLEALGEEILDALFPNRGRGGD